jgi:AAA15 family ATPase/GTPase
VVMYSSFTARNFRCFRELTIEPLQEINLITGRNNAGKTALLEALWLHHGYQNPALGANADAFRGVARFRREEFLQNLFLDFDTEKPIELSSRDRLNQVRSLRIQVQHPAIRSVFLNEEEGRNGKEPLDVDIASQKTPELSAPEVSYEFTDVTGGTIHARAFFERENLKIEEPPGILKSRGIFLAARAPHGYREIAERLGDITFDKRISWAVEVLQAVDPRITDLRQSVRGDVPLIYADIGAKRLMPLALLGDGIGRLLRIAVNIPYARHGILLVDEIENGLHHSVLVSVWKAIIRFAAKRDVQLFATTHSWECVASFQKAFDELSKDDITGTLIRLEREGDKIKAIPYSLEELSTAVEQEIEVR